MSETPETISNVNTTHQLPEPLPIILAGWVLQDGNYDDFVAGTQREFALSFYTRFDNPLRQVEQGQPTLRATGSYGEYEVTARVIYNNIEGDAFRQADACWVLDLGGVMAYDTHTPHILDGPTPRVGDTLRGTVSLGVDDFDYFERLAHVPGIPPLIYSWDVETVEIDETPREAIHPNDPRFGPFIPPSEGPIYLPDLTREKWRPLPQTRMWEDRPEGAGLYRMHCSRRDTEPTKAFKKPQVTRKI